jgi:hypothetical protein
MSDAAPQSQGVSDPAQAPPNVPTADSVPPPPPSPARRPSIGLVMLEWAVNVVVGFLLIGGIATAAIYFMVGPNYRQIAVPLGIFLGITLGAVIGSKTKIVHLIK